MFDGKSRDFNRRFPFQCIETLEDTCRKRSGTTWLRSPGLMVMMRSLAPNRCAYGGGIPLNSLGNPIFFHGTNRIFHIFLMEWVDKLWYSAIFHVQVSCRYQYPCLLSLLERWTTLWHKNRGASLELRSNGLLWLNTFWSLCSLCFPAALDYIYIYINTIWHNWAEQTTLHHKETGRSKVALVFCWCWQWCLFVGCVLNVRKSGIYYAENLDRLVMVLFITSRG